MPRATRRPSRTRLVALLVAALAASALGGVVAAPAHADDSQYAKIYGFITRTDGSTAHADAVYLYSVSLDASGNAIVSTARQYKSIVLGQNGAAANEYIFTNVAPGAYLIEFGQPNNPSASGTSAFQWFNGIPGVKYPADAAYPGGSGFASGATPVLVKAGDGPEADMVVRGGNTISAELTHGSTPIGTLPVVDLYDAEGGRADGLTSANGVTGYLGSSVNASGGFTFTNLASGTYTLSVLPYDNGVDCNTSYVVTLDNPGGAVNPGYSFDLAQEAIFNSTPVPTVSGDAVVGSTLTADPGPWDTHAALSYQWYANGKPLPGQTKQSLTLTAAMLNQTIYAVVTGAAPSYCTTSQNSAATWNVQGVITSTSAPNLSGNIAVRQKLTASTGSWNVSGAAFTYQWLSNNQPIAGATTSVFTAAAAYYKKQISVRVTASKTGYVTATATSIPKTLAAGALTHTPVPKITGTVMVGKTLTAKPGTWAPGKPKFSYRWYANGKALKTGTKYKLTVSRSLVGKSLSVRVTGKLTGFVSVTESSLGTKAVVAKKAPVKKKAKKK